MNIALINLSYPNIVRDTLSIPLGLAWISSVLKGQGYNVSCIDLALCPEDINIIEENYFDVICFQLHSEEAYNNSVMQISEIKRENKSIIIVGGITATLFWKQIVKNRHIDFVVIGEGEVTILELLSYIKDSQIDIFNIKGIAFRDGNDIVNTGQRVLIENLDNLPLPDRESFKASDYPQWSIITSRGCPYSCAFCTVPQIWDGKYRFRSSKNVYEEICNLSVKFKMNKFFILDDTFTFKRNNVIELMNLLISDPRDFEWACLSRGDLLDEELIFLLKKAGCTEISIGIESANQDILTKINKNLSLTKTEEAIMLLKKYDIRVRCSYIFGLPFETIQHVENSIDFILKTQPHEVQIYPMFKYTGTEIFSNKEFDIKESTIRDLSGIKKNALNPIFETENLSKEQINSLVRKCIKSLEELGYTWLSSSKNNLQKKYINKVVMTEFAPIQSL